jgi:hypothetical protein
MDLEPEVWERVKRMPKQGDFIYVEQICPVRAFIGQVVLIWTNENGRQVIAVVDGANDVINLAEDDRWVSYHGTHREVATVEILKRSGLCICCDAPLLADRSGNIDHAWLWT